MTARDAWSLLAAAAGYLWWTWIASRWSGGGPRHPSYGTAKFNAYVRRCYLQDWIRGRV